MIATFCGHSRISQSAEVEKWLYTVTQRLIEQGITTFYLGGYGAFDSLAASVLRKQKKRYPQIELVLVLAYLKTRQDISYYDSTVYPPLEAVPRRFAISYRNRWMVESTDVIVAYVLHDWGELPQRCNMPSKKETDYFLCRKIGKTAEATLLKGYYDAHNRCLSVCSKRPHCRLIHPRVFAYE